MKQQPSRVDVEATDSKENAQETSDFIQTLPGQLPQPCLM